MRKVKVSLRKCLALLFLITISLITFAEPYYKVDNLKITAQINNDGSVDVTEFAQYNAYDINGILYNIDYKSYGNLKNLQVYYEQNSEFVPAKKNETRQKGTYSLQNDDGLAEIKLYFPMSEETKWFAFTYTLPQGVTVYNDTAQFNRKMVGQSWQTDIENIEVKIILPEKTDTKNINAFGHGPLTGNVDIINGQEIVYTLQDYCSGDFVEANILFPKSLVPKINPALVKNKNNYEKIMKMEADLADKANRQREFAKMKGTLGNIFFCFWWCWIIFVVAFNYIKNKKKYKVINEYGEYFREAPDNFSPAVGGAVVSRRVLPNQLLATVMDLVRRDIFEMVENKSDNQTILKLNSDTMAQKMSEFKNYEKFLIKWYIDELGNGEQVVMEDIERYISSKKNALAFGRNYEKWEEMVKADLKKVGFKKEPLHKLPIILGMATGFLSLPIGVFSAVYFDNGKFIMFPFVSFAVIVLTISTSGKYTLEAEKLRAKWLAFKKFLVDYSNLEEAKLASIHIWEHYFVYAIALGVAEKVAAGYKKIFRESDLKNSSMDNFHRRMPLMYMYETSRAFRNVERTTTNAINRSTSALANSRRSSSSGRGGGFSGGSSGGGGGRGGGGAF